MRYGALTNWNWWCPVRVFSCFYQFNYRINYWFVIEYRKLLEILYISRTDLPLNIANYFKLFQNNTILSCTHSFRNYFLKTFSIFNLRGASDAFRTLFKSFYDEQLNLKTAESCKGGGTHLLLLVSKVSRSIQVSSRSLNWLQKNSHRIFNILLVIKTCFLYFSHKLTNHTFTLKKTRSDLIEIWPLHAIRENFGWGQIWGSLFFTMGIPL